MKTALSFLKRVEACAYPPHMRMMQDYNTLSDLAEYCECKKREVFVICGEDYYLIAAEKGNEIEVVDMASLNGMGKVIFGLVRTCRERWAGKSIKMDLRESTSYPLLLSLSRRYGIKMTEEGTWEWEDEIMHCVSLSIPKQGT